MGELQLNSIPTPQLSKGSTSYSLTITQANKESKPKYKVKRLDGTLLNLEPGKDFALVSGDAVTGPGKVAFEFVLSSPSELSSARRLLS